MIFNMTSGKMKTPVLNTAYPADVTVNAGTDAAFQVEIAEDGLPKEHAYQWYVNETAVSGATSASYTRDTASDMGVYSVYCVVTNKAGAVTSRTATLTVQKAPVLNGSYPANATVVKHTAVTSKVSVSTDGYPTSYTYQWYKNGSAVSGATGSSYTFTPTATGTTTLYCKVTNAAGTVTSRTATITATDLYLYNAGDQCTAVTGGWKKAGGNTTFTFGSSSITYANGGETSNYATLYTVNKINVTSFSTMKIYLNVTSGGGGYNCLVLHTNNTDKQTYGTACVKVTSTGTQTLSLDVSSLTGSYYVGFCVTASSGSVYKIWLT